MSELLNRYFERELALVRRSGDKFKGRHSAAGNSMHLNEKRYEDPNITRLLESVALLSAKNEMKLDQQLPHLSNALCSVLYPSFNQLLPSVMSVSFEGEEEFVENIQLKKGEAFSVENDKGQPCQFRLCNDTLLSPVTLTEVSARFAPFPFDLPVAHDANAVIQLTLEANDVEAVMAELAPESLSLYLHGFGQGAAGLIELLLSQLTLIAVSDPDFSEMQLLPVENFKPRCINEDFSVLTRQGNEFSAYQMMLEYFNYSEKRKYFHIRDFNAACRNISGNKLVLSLFVKEIPAEYIGLFDTSVFKLNTALVVNQFTSRAEPIHYNHKQLSAPLVADAVNHNADIDIISIESVSEVKPDGEYPLQPLFGKRYFDESNGLLWFSESHVNDKKKFQHHLVLSFEQAAAHQLQNGQEHLLTAQLNCCNGRAPCSISAGSVMKLSGALELPGKLVSHNIPTVPYYPNESQAIHWKLVELLSTNFSALINSDNPTEKLRNLLSVFSRSSQQQVLTSSIQKVSYQKKVARLYIDGVNIFTSGTLIKLDISVFDKKNSMNIWLFTHLLNQFFAAFCSFDRFVELEVKLLTGKGPRQIRFEKYHGSGQCL
ncbi:type VI secretion system baseplate subunit TssF [Thalassomonas viridans]|uniref:Type VI secretion system baseplate subunit TssF n=1 Tax=Thalassomonas viridans TaxID=137584 RepID=A0AAF0C9Y7_9GAMM|nr:type VI secretion system baseplate subunit TssF [Thalassomonas viridans]WDE05324.1 type VI secretion system baseplate subunit TssF [Thalassomonas viridans]